MDSALALGEVEHFPVDFQIVFLALLLEFSAFDFMPFFDCSWWNAFRVYPSGAAGGCSDG